MTGRIPKEQVHKDFDPHYFHDYAVFTGVLRHYVARSIEVLFRQDQNDMHKRLYVLGLVKEEYAAYEDIGAIFSSLLKWKAGKIDYPVEEMLTYRPGNVVLERLFNEHSISSEDDLYSTLELDTWVPPTWNSIFPDIDARKVLRIACKFIFKDCQQNQKKVGIQAYNKIKHGLLFVPDGKQYVPSLPDSPAVIFDNRDSTNINPYVLYCLKTTEDYLQELEKAIEFVQKTLRMIAAFYVFHRYPRYLPDRGISPSEMLFKAKTMTEIADFMREITEKK